MDTTDLTITEHLEINPPEAPRKPYLCRHIFVDGRQCGSRALRSQNFCYYHYSHRTPVLVNQRRRQPRSGFDLTRLDGLDNHTAIQLSLSEVLGRIASNSIDRKSAWLLLYGLQIAANNLRNIQRAHPIAEVPLPDTFVEDASHGQLAQLEEGRTEPPSLFDRLCVFLKENPDADLRIPEDQT